MLHRGCLTMGNLFSDVHKRVCFVSLLYIQQLISSHLELWHLVSFALHINYWT